MSELHNAVEILRDRLFFSCVRDLTGLRSLPQGSTAFCVDNELIYEPFFADFGPLNMGQAYRFCEKCDALVRDAEKRNARVYFLAQAQPNFRANACVLIGIYQVMVLGRSAEEAIRLIEGFGPFQPYRDASCGPSSFPLSVQDCIRGMDRANKAGLVSFLPLGQPSGFHPEEYEHYEQVEHGDLNWIVPGKIVAFGGPHAKRTEFYGYRTLVPEDYHDYFHRRGVSAVIRLNKRVYDRRRFTDAGFRHYEMYFPDGTCPTEAIMRRFLSTVESEPGAVAVHCKAGLGRTGVLACCYMCKHFGFTAEEAIGYIRVCRPGSVIGPQQHFLKQMQGWLHREGRMLQHKLVATGSSKRGPGFSDADSLASTQANSAACSSPDADESGGATAVRESADGDRSPTRALNAATRPAPFMTRSAIQSEGGAGLLRASAPVGTALAAVRARQGTPPATPPPGNEAPAGRAAPPAGPSAASGRASLPASPAGTARRLETGAGVQALVARLSRTRIGSVGSLGGPPGSAYGPRAPSSGSWNASVAPHPARTASGLEGDTRGRTRTPVRSASSGHVLGLTATATSSTGGLSGVQRIVTRSGQPRKLPAALAAQAQAQGRAYSPTGAKGPADYGFGQLGKVPSRSSSYLSNARSSTVGLGRSTGGASRGVDGMTSPVSTPDSALAAK